MKPGLSPQNFLTVADAAKAAWHSDAEVPADVAGERGEPAWLRTDSLVIDRRYQREIQRQGAKTIRKIVETFDWAKFSPLIVSPAEGHGLRAFAILDGQHRAIAAHVLKIEHVPCMVHRLNLREQARVFRDVNATVTQVSRLALHYAGVMAGQPDAIGVHTVCQAAGVKVMTSNRVRSLMKPNETVAVQAISKALKTWGAATVQRGLSLIVSTSETSSELGARTILVLCHAIARAPEAKDETIRAVLCEYSIEDLLELERGKSQPGLVVRSVVDFLVSRFRRSEIAA